jgi:hypothetical protein
MKVLVSGSELAVLREAILSEKSDLKLNVDEDRENGRILLISEIEADALRDLCGDYMSVVGFDADYNPNEKGVLLEELIDKLFVG